MEVRRSAVIALGRLGKKGREGDLVSRFLEDAEWRVRREAREIMGLAPEPNLVADSSGSLIPIEQIGGDGTAGGARQPQARVSLVSKL